MSLSSPIGAALFALLMIVAVGCGLGLRRVVSAMAAAGAVESCPFEREP